MARSSVCCAVSTSTQELLRAGCRDRHAEIGRNHWQQAHGANSVTPIPNTPAVSASGGGLNFMSVISGSDHGRVQTREPFLIVVGRVRIGRQNLARGVECRDLICGQ